MTTITSPRPLAPAIFVGVQEGFGPIPAIELYNLTAPVGEYRIGGTVSRKTLEDAGYLVPPAPIARTSPYALREARRAAWYRRNFDYTGYRTAA